MRGDPEPGACEEGHASGDQEHALGMPTKAPIFTARAISRVVIVQWAVQPTPRIAGSTAPGFPRRYARLTLDDVGVGDAAALVISPGVGEPEWIGCGGVSRIDTTFLPWRQASSLDGATTFTVVRPKPGVSRNTTRCPSGTYPEAIRPCGGGAACGSGRP